MSWHSADSKANDHALERGEARQPLQTGECNIRQGSRWFSIPPLLMSRCDREPSCCSTTSPAVARFSHSSSSRFTSLETSSRASRLLVCMSVHPRFRLCRLGIAQNKDRSNFAFRVPAAEAGHPSPLPGRHHYTREHTDHVACICSGGCHAIWPQMWLSKGSPEMLRSRRAVACFRKLTLGSE